MRLNSRILPALVIVAGGVGAAAQSPFTSDIVAEVRAAMASGGVTQGEQVLADYRATHAMTPEGLEALAWLARGALSAQLFDKATQYAGEDRDLARTALAASGGAASAPLQRALGSAIEVMALTLTEQGARADAVYLLRGELETYRGTPLGDELQSSMRLLSLEGRPAPSLDPGIAIGPRVSTGKNAARQPTLLFFWAHWCQDCKAESPMIAKAAEKYRARGLAIVAPTRRYGYAQGGRPAAPDKELRHIAQVRDSNYAFLKHDPVPVSDANYRAFGVSVVPMHVLIDREGVVRLYHPGRMTAAELDAAILTTLERPKP